MYPIILYLIIYLKNMIKIIMSYVKKNEKPIPFIKGIKICNSSMTKE